MPAFFAEVGLPYWIDLTTSDPDKSAEFYAKVLGWEVAQEDGAYRLGRVKGLPVGGFIPQPDGASAPDTWVTYFMAADIEADCTRAAELGGRVLVAPQAVAQGRMALLADVTGALFGLIEPAGAEKFVAAGEPGLPVWHELTVTSQFTAALDFYGELFNWEIRAMAADDQGGDSVGEEFEYALAEEEGAPFVGFFNARGHFPTPVPSFWQTYLGVRDIDAAVASAQECGGEVVRAPWDSPFGRMCVLADVTGATITLTEVADAPEDDPRESDDLLG